MALDFLTGCFGWKPSKLSRCSEKATRAWMRALKIILVIPSAIAAFGARGSYLRIKEHSDLSQWPYDENVGLAFLLTYVGCITIFSWVFVSLALLAKWQGPWILLYGLIDFGLAVTVATGIGMQANFLPASLTGCNGSNADTWQVEGDYPSFFTLTGHYLGDGVTAEATCRAYVSDWTIAVSTVFFQMFVAYVGIFFDEREYSILNPMRPVVWLIVVIIGPPILLHDLVFPRVRLGLSYIRKVGSRARASKDLKIPQARQFKPPYDRFNLPDTKLMDVLVIEHVLLNIVDHIHYEDVINLSLTSRAVREVVFPPRDLDYRIPKLKERCCETATKVGCLYCNKRICFWCKAQRFLPGLPGRRHVSACQPYCRACYYKNFSRHPRGYKRPCKCHTTDRSHEFQDMCRSCALKEPVQMQIIRHKRYQQQARDTASGNGLKEGEKVRCGGCRGELKAGTRWWVCGKCKGECRDGIHPPYVGKKRAMDVEKGENKVLEMEEPMQPWWRKLIAQ